MMSSIGEAFLSIFVPTEDEQRAQRYSYSSPSGRTKSNFFRTGTAALHLGQYREVASNSLKLGSRMHPL
jgi:hypothetical protein